MSLVGIAVGIQIGYISWRKLEKNSWTDRVKNGVSHRVKEERNILHSIRDRKVNWIGHILSRNCLIKQGIEGEREGTGRRGRRPKQLLDGLKEKRRCWKLKEEALDSTLRLTGFVRGNGSVIKTDNVMMKVIFL
jgi:hypothetical protein